MMELLNDLANNWELLGAAVMAIMAGADKVALVCIATLKNIQSAWFTAFPKQGETNK